VFSGYLHLPEKTKSAFTGDGYFRTGDVGYLDPEGYLHLMGRASEMIVLAGGENIRPDMVENVFAQGEHIREVGVLEYEGRLVALIVPKLTPNSLRDTTMGLCGSSVVVRVWCRSTHAVGLCLILRSGSQRYGKDTISSGFLRVPSRAQGSYSSSVQGSA